MEQATACLTVEPVAAAGVALPLGGTEILGQASECATLPQLTCFFTRRFFLERNRRPDRMETSLKAPLGITTMPNISVEALEAELLARARQGDVAALRELLDRARPVMASAVRLLTTNASAAEDLVQESLVRLWRAFEDTGYEASLCTWAYRVARNHALNWIRDEANRRRLLDQHGYVVPLAAMGQPPSDPEMATINGESARRAVSAVNSLPEEDRELLNQSIENAAQDPTTTPGTVLTSTQRSKLLRARRKVRSHVEDSGKGKP